MQRSYKRINLSNAYQCHCKRIRCYNPIAGKMPEKIYFSYFLSLRSLAVFKQFEGDRKAGFAFKLLKPPSYAGYCFLVFSFRWSRLPKALENLCSHVLRDAQNVCIYSKDAFVLRLDYQPLFGK